MAPTSGLAADLPDIVYRINRPESGVLMGYVVERCGRFYAVCYDGVDPITGRERRRGIR
jgi:hypothetical protein